MEYVEFKGTTKSDAITEACTHFSVTSDKLEYEVIEEGKAGFLGLGIGAKPAVIKARIKEEDNAKRESASKADSAKASSGVRAKAEAPVKPAVLDEGSSAPHSGKEDGNAAVKIDGAAAEAAVKKFLGDVFKAMGMTVETQVKYAEAQNTINVELSGDDMGVLIGKRGQTLDSLQYLISLVVNKGTGEYIRVKVDTENYRERRKETLENLARNISFKVKRTRRPISLEPMNPYERRIIHSALQNDKYVTTHSEGEEPFRCVVIVPKKENSYYDRSGSYDRNKSGYSKGSYDRNKGGYSKGGSYAKSGRSYSSSYSRNSSYGKSYDRNVSNGGYSRGYADSYDSSSETKAETTQTTQQQALKSE